MTYFHVKEPFGSYEELYAATSVDGKEVQFTVDISLDELMTGVDTVNDIMDMNVFGDDLPGTLDDIKYAVVSTPHADTVRLRVTAYVENAA